MVIPAPVEPALYNMVFRFRPFVSPGKHEAQHLEITVNGRKTGAFVVSDRAVRVCQVPWDAIQGRRELEITFDTPDAAVPASLDSGDGDTRLLAIAFESLHVYPDPGAGLPITSRATPATGHAAIDDRELMFKFESLGENCEFGLVQRRCGAEPLGLLRFASTPMRHLLGALDGRFRGLGAPDTLAVEVSASGQEYMVADKQYGLRYHAWVKVGEMPPDDIHHRESRRLPILVRKMIEDLEGADKTFVIKGMGPVAEEEVLPLVAATRRYGPNTVLLVTLADQHHPATTVEWRAPGFMTGYIRRFAPGDNAHDLLLDDWLSICREAYRLRCEVAG